MAIAPQRVGLGLRRHFTTEGVHPYDEVRWERRDSRIVNHRDGSVAFEQLGVEVPESWSQNAANILAQKYFRGTLGTREREWSLKQVTDRVVDTLTAWGIKDGYFADGDEAEIFRDELKHLIVHQKAAFNSPVWFNIGVEGVPQQGSACQPYDALVSTPAGMVPIGRLVEENAVGAKVLDAHGVTRIVAVKHNGRKEVLRIHTKSGHALDVTADHLVWRCSDEHSTDGDFVETAELVPGDLLQWHEGDRFGAAAIDAIDVVGEMDVYDIQTESGEYLSANLRVHNCFILSVDDSMDSILNWYTEEGIIFKGGSGAGVNLSRIRASHELLKGGGTASGPVSFMRGADASAGTIKSGGKTRRAAKMVILDADHPDIEDFIWCKALEERKARVLAAAGFDMDLDGSDSYSIQYQNANNSVRVADEFMEAVLDGRDWELTARTDGSVIRKVPARDLFRQIAHAAWECADPGMQFDTTINKWHTAPNAGRINGSNPCFPGSARVHTDKGLIPFNELFARANDGEVFEVYTHDATNSEAPSECVLLTGPEAFMITGYNEVVRLRLDNGMELSCTPGHRIFTVNRGYVEAHQLTSSDEIKVLDLPAPAVNADPALPVATDAMAYREKGDHAAALEFPAEWTTDFGHYLGWLIGDGSTSGAVVATIYGSQEDRAEILPLHADLIAQMNGGRAVKVSEQANGTAQLRMSRRAFKRFIESLGVRSVKGPEKTVPWAIEQAPHEIVAAFLRGLFDADGCVVTSDHGSYVGLGSTSRTLLRDVQRLLTTFGILSRLYKTSSSPSGRFSYTNKSGQEQTYGHSNSYDLRITSASIGSFAEHIGFSLQRKAALLRDLLLTHDQYEVRRTAHLLERTDEGVELTYNLSEPRNHSYIVDGVVVRNCSEYMHLDNSACNLASLNLMKFLKDDGTFDVAGFKAAVEVVFTGQEIIVGNADYPTEKIAENSRRFRELGLGYANLGALLMANGLPYDSDAGRAWAAAITALMTGHAYSTSARTAARMGPFAGFHENAEPMVNVLRMHQGEAAKIDEELVPPELLSAAQEAWDEAVDLAEKYGVRNSQASVLAPTGTIGLLMDCDTTGVEPDLGLVKTKKLVGGGTMSIVNQTVPRALRQLGYTSSEIDDIVAHIDEHKSVVGAPNFRTEHLAVFACSMGDNTIHYSGHVRMMGAVQPFISGAISKCVTGDTLVASEDGLVRIGHLYEGERADTFRPERRLVASVGGPQKTDAFYYGGERPVRRVVLRSGHAVTGTPNHRLMVAGDGELTWRRLDEIEVGDEVATHYGADMWAQVPTRLAFRPGTPAARQEEVRIPREMTGDLAFLLGAYASEGSISRSTWTIRITSSVESVLERLAASVRATFGIEPAIRHPENRCPFVEISSRTVGQLFEQLGCGAGVSAKRIPDVVLRSTREHVLTFLQGLALGAYVTVAPMGKWGICLDSSAMLDDLQAVLTNLGVVHGRIGKPNATNGKTYDEVYATGPHAQTLARLVPFLEPDKAEAAGRLLARSFARSTSDVVPGITGPELYRLLPLGRRARFGHLLDRRIRQVSRKTLERISAIEGVALPAWLRMVLRDGLHFSPVAEAEDAGVREVYDLSVPSTHAFVGNGIVNHNTVNMPEEVTVEEVEQLHIDAWKLGIKAVAIYRDNCKVAQPLSTTKKEGGDTAPPGSEAEAKDRQVADRIAELEAALESERQRRSEPVVVGAVRERLPRRRQSKTFAFRVADCEGYVTVGEYEDGRPGEVFIKVSKQGSTLAGIMDAFSISISLGLQHGVPLATYVRKYTNLKFEPAGITDDPDLRIATSLVDYIFRRLALDYLSHEDRLELGVLSTSERIQPTLPGVEESATPSRGVVDETVLAAPVVPQTAAGDAGSTLARAEQRDAPFCYNCGDVMQRAGSCYVCTSCGSTSGCS